MSVKCHCSLPQSNWNLTPAGLDLNNSDIVLNYHTIISRAESHCQVSLRASGHRGQSWKIRGAMPWGEKGSEGWAAGATLSYAELCSCRARRVPYSLTLSLWEGGSSPAVESNTSPTSAAPGMENKPQVIATARGQLLDLRSTLG